LKKIRKSGENKGGGAGEMRVKKIECVGKENLQKKVNIIQMKRLIER